MKKCDIIENRKPRLRSFSVLGIYILYINVYISSSAIRIILYKYKCQSVARMAGLILMTAQLQIKLALRLIHSRKMLPKRSFSRKEHVKPSLFIPERVLCAPLVTPLASDVRDGIVIQNYTIPVFNRRIRIGTTQCHLFVSETIETDCF